MSTQHEEKRNKEYIRRLFVPETGEYVFIYGSRRVVSKDKDLLTRGLTLQQEVAFHMRYNIKDGVFDPTHPKRMRERKEKERAIARGMYNPFKD